MNLMTNEEILMEGDYKQITLTTHRIRQENKAWGNVNLTSIMLEEVTSCEHCRKSKPMFLLVGLILAGLAIYIGEKEGRFAIYNINSVIPLASVVSIIIYYFTIRRGLFISSASAKIVVNTQGMKDKNIELLIDRLEDAKNERLLMLKSS